MGDLQCAARIFVARHGAADYESELLSDAGGWLSPLGRQQSRELAGQVEGERISRVWTSDLSRAVQTGEIVAARTGVDVTVRTGLREFGVGDAAGTTGDPDPFASTFAAWLGGDLSARIPGGESGLEVVARYEAVLEEVADAPPGRVGAGGQPRRRDVHGASAAGQQPRARPHARHPAAQLRRGRARGRRRRLGGPLLGWPAARLRR